MALFSSFLTDIESQCSHDFDDNSKTDTNETQSFENLSQQQLIDKLKQSEEYIKGLQNQIKSMNEVMNNCLTEDQTSSDRLNVIHLSNSEDSYYMSSYSHYSIHYEMLSDSIRTDSYRDAILKNSNYFEGKYVLDIGCGTGILSLFAAKAGAELVVAVDQSDIIYHAMDIVRENRLNHKIKFIKSKVESINFIEHNLPQKYDIIISEWMGYFLLFEGMLDTILFARNNLLNESGILMPNHCLLSIAGLSDESFHNKYLAFWDNVYGWKMSCMKNEVIKEANIEVVSKDKISTSIATIKEFDLMQCCIEETQIFNSKFQLISNSDEPIVAIVGWFDCYFNSQQLDHKVILSTSPFNRETHWKQTVFLLKNALLVKKGETVSGTIDVFRNKKDIRSLVIEIKIDNYEKQVYYLS
jgi:protein arginine N-methyltransferase 3